MRSTSSSFRHAKWEQHFSNGGLLTQLGSLLELEGMRGGAVASGNSSFHMYCKAGIFPNSPTGILTLMEVGVAFSPS